MKLGLRGSFIALGAGVSLFCATAQARPFDFHRDTFGFANMTVFAYQNGHASVRRGADSKQQRYTRRCFVLARTAMQFRKFARFDPKAPPLDDRALIARLRELTRIAAWKKPLPENEKIVFPGYADVRELSDQRARIVQDNVSKGWPTYWRPGNSRMFFFPGSGYQKKTHENLDATLARDELFAGYLTTFPNFSINHAVLVYAKDENHPADGSEHYLVYDSNHPETPRELWWSEKNHAFGFQKDWDFVGGFVRVYQVYGKQLQ